MTSKSVDVTLCPSLRIVPLPRLLYTRGRRLLGRGAHFFAGKRRPVPSSLLLSYFPLLSPDERGPRHRDENGPAHLPRLSRSRRPGLAVDFDEAYQTAVRHPPPSGGTSGQWGMVGRACAAFGTASSKLSLEFFLLRVFVEAWRKAVAMTVSFGAVFFLGLAQDRHEPAALSLGSSSPEGPLSSLANRRDTWLHRGRSHLPRFAASSQPGAQHDKGREEDDLWQAKGACRFWETTYSGLLEELEVFASVQSPTIANARLV
jgi:hypothetical protein